MNTLNVLLSQSFKHMTDSEANAKKIVEEYVNGGYDLKKSVISRKVKKGVEYWTVTVDVQHVIEKDAFEINFE